MSLEEITELVEPLWDDNPVWKGIDVGPGWYPLVADIITRAHSSNIHFTIAQIKQKFGALRFYAGQIHTEGAHGEFYDIVNQIEAISELVCEQCGMPGTLRREGWVRTLCDPCLRDYSPYTRKT
jgi:hypothetical protein